METKNGNYTYPHERDRSAESANSVWAGASAQEVHNAHEDIERQPIDSRELVQNIGKGIIRLRIIAQQETLGQTDRSWDAFEPTR